MNTLKSISINKKVYEKNQWRFFMLTIAGIDKEISLYIISLEEYIPAIDF